MRGYLEQKHRAKHQHCDRPRSDDGFGGGNVFLGLVFSAHGDTVRKA